MERNAVSSRVPLRRGLLTVALTALAAACGPPEPDEGDYVTLLLEGRAFKDEFLKNDPSSRVPLDRRSWMVPLRYYEPDLSYRVPANLAIADDQIVFELCR